MVTALFCILDKDKRPRPCRGLLDTCSTTNFITERLANTLLLKKSTCNVAIGALNTLTTYAKGMITATIKSRVNNFERILTFLIVPTIAPLIPDQPINRNNINIPANVTLADPNFHQPAPIDVLLGTGTTLSLLAIGQLRVDLPENRELFLQKTLLGWIVGGAAPLTNQSNNRRTCHVTTPLEFNLSKFWELEECPIERKYSNDEEQCEDHFRKNITRNQEGRYVVALPFNSHKPKLGESYHLALKRLENTEKGLNHNLDLQKKYNEILKEYVDLGHMTPVTNDTADPSNYYLPHYAVIKDSSMTTKVRVVFDGSAKTTSGISLNDTLFTGPTIQSDLFSILIRFRKHPIVLTGDIEKMYRQFLVRKEDRKFQRILWRREPNKLQEYELNTVTFGLAAAPYLAIRCLHQLADDEGQEFIKAAEVIKNDFYVDDVLTGANTQAEAINLRLQLTTILSRAGLSIRQWASNDTTVLENIPKESMHLQLQLGETPTLKTLGIHWNSTTDSITYSVKLTKNIPRITKRYILSETAKIFDPLGLLAPVIIIAKIMIQQLWNLKLHWDESLPNDIHTKWQKYYNQLQSLNNLSFPRTIITSNIKDIQIHGFSDASERAYGACIYLRITDIQDKVKILLLCAKSRVAPLKTQTIPRLELCGAQLLVTLTDSVINAIKLKINRTYFWSDSMIVLHWLRSTPQQLKTFVSNRVAEIQRKSEIYQWSHVRTKDNPADLVSRGVLPEEFISSTLWRAGPTWLVKSEEQWPHTLLPPLELIPEQRSATCLIMSTTFEIENMFKKFSTIGKLVRTLSYCLRFTTKGKLKGPLTVNELKITLTRVIKAVQHQTFNTEMKAINQNSPIKSNSPVIKLHPFIDEHGLLRVGGRLTFSNLPYDSKYPIILPKNHHITKLIIENEHKIHLHSGVQQTLYCLRRRFWPIDGRSQVWKVIKNCVVCHKTNPQPTNYLMGNLPQARVNQSQPFNHVGVDYCGPFILKEKKFRNKSSIKTYVAVFVCMAVKAVHLELVTDLTTEGFISALRRFISRRGLCQHIYSDNGRNFTGANNTLKELFKLFNDSNHQEAVQGYLTTKNIQWHFNPPQAPHVGGLWEAAVKSFKKHLKYVAGRDLLFTYEQFNTLIIEIEAILNSRPLTPLSSDPNDPIVLTPGHFLIGDSLTNLHGRDHNTTPTNLLSTWEHIQKVKQHFWKRWSHEYLNELTTRTKWTTDNPNMHPGAIVLLRDDNLPPTQWALGRIIDCFPGSDGVIRTVSVKTATTTFIRNVKKLSILPVHDKKYT